MSPGPRQCSVGEPSYCVAVLNNLNRVELHQFIPVVHDREYSSSNMILEGRQLDGHINSSNGTAEKQCPSRLKDSHCACDQRLIDETHHEREACRHTPLQHQLEQLSSRCLAGQLRRRRRLLCPALRQQLSLCRPGHEEVHLGREPADSSSERRGGKQKRRMRVRMM